MTEPPRFLQFVLRQMQVAERIVLGLWASVAAGCVAIFASALPYIYAQEDRIRCGSLGLTRVAIELVPQCIVVAVMLTALFSLGRGLIATYRWRWASGLSLVGGIFWVSAAITGAGGFAWFVNEDLILVSDPPPLPADLTDTKACNEFIVNAKPYDPVKEWLLQHMMQPDQMQDRYRTK